VGGGDEAGFAEGLQRLADFRDHAYALAVEVGSCSSALRLCGANFSSAMASRRVEHGERRSRGCARRSAGGRQGFGIEDFEELESRGRGG
jgi:hypothetical protein